MSNRKPVPAPCYPGSAEALARLVDQIDRTNPVDDHGHNFKMNKAFLDAKVIIDGPRDYRVCYHHVQSPTNRIVYPTQEPLLSYAEAEKEVAQQRAKGWAVAWIIARDGLGARDPRLHHPEAAIAPSPREWFSDLNERVSKGLLVDTDAGAAPGPSDADLVLAQEQVIADLREQLEEAGDRIKARDAQLFVAERVSGVAQASAKLPAIPDDDADFTPDLARKIIAKYQQLLTAQTWQPIETAPRDGTPVLAFRPDSFTSGFSFESGIDVVWWDDGCWQTVGDAITIDLPTHWMPLPAAPVVSSTEGASDWPKEEIEPGQWIDVDPEAIARPWPPLKKALWDVLMVENLNDGHYIKAFHLIEKLWSVACSVSSTHRGSGE